MSPKVPKSDDQDSNERTPRQDRGADMETTTRTNRTIRTAPATAALAAAIVMPAAVATATPASAAGGGYSPLICGTSGNHNETAGRDRRRRSPRLLSAFAALAVAAALTVAIPTPGAHAAASARPSNGGDVIRAWTALALDTVRDTKASDAAAARLYAMVDIAMFDAVNGLESRSERRQPALVAPDDWAEGSPTAAAAGAAHDVLAALYPTRAGIYDTRLSQDLAAAPTPSAAHNGRAWGHRVATAVLAARNNDGSAPGETLNPPHTPPSVGEFATSWSGAQYRNLRPFAISDPSAYVTAGPPALTSAEYAEAFNEVKQAGSRDTIDPGADATFSFWRLDGGTSQPPGAWMQVAANVSRARALSLQDTARLFALESIALADSVAPTYTTKATYWFWRPTTAINRAAEDGNDATDPPADGTTWVARANSVGSSPEHSSGHSTFSAAGAAVLAGFFCDDTIAFSLTSDSTPDAPRTYSSFSSAADEAGRSRVVGGLHFEFSNQTALTAGRSIAREVLAHSLLRTAGPTHNGDCPL